MVKNESAVTKKQYVSFFIIYSMFNDNFLKVKLIIINQCHLIKFLFTVYRLTMLKGLVGGETGQCPNTTDAIIEIFNSSGAWP